MNQCNICRRSYVLPNDLQRHMKLNHKSDQHQENTGKCSKQQQQQSVISPQQQQQINLSPQQQQDFNTSQQQQQAFDISPQQQQQQQNFQFKHPFTANISGPTSCGKTYFVKLRLQNCLTKIAPPPERIIWLYKRWQPLYDVIKDTVSPCVELRRGYQWIWKKILF